MSERALQQVSRKPQTSFWKAVWAVAWKDLAAERRSREILSAMLTFSLLVVIIFNFSLDLNPKIQQEVTGGLLWVTFTFAGTLGLNRSMAIEKDRGCLDGLLLAPVDRSAIYFGKAIGNLVFMLVVEIIVLPVFSIFYNVNLFKLSLFGVILLGSIGYVVVGTLFATMTVQTRSRDMLLPIITFPVVFPLIVAAARATTFLLQGQPMDLIWPSINLMLAFDVIFITAAYLLFDLIVEE